MFDYGPPRKAAHTMKRALAAGFLLMLAAAKIAPAQEPAANVLNVSALPDGAVQVLITRADAEGESKLPVIPADTTLPHLFPGKMEIDVGFEFLHPYFSNRAVTLSLPTGSPSSFSVVTGSGNVSDGFDFVPKFGIEYQFPDLGFGIGASGKKISLSGSLQRTLDTAEGSATLNINSSLEIATANLGELSSSWSLDSFECLKDTFLGEIELLGSVGGRYAYVRQDYNANLASGTNSTSLGAHEDFTGFGLTTSWEVLIPLPREFYLYTVSRGSFLIGTNNRDTHFSAAIPGSSVNSSGKVTENKTTLISVGEFEAGIEWATPLWPPRKSETSDKPWALLWIKAGLVGEVWGGLGFLSATGNGAHFTDGNLVLFGFTVVAGVEF